MKALVFHKPKDVRLENGLLPPPKRAPSSPS